MLTRDLQHSDPWATPLSWGGSLLVHALLAVLILSNLKSCARQGDFGQAEVYRVVGITYATPETATETEPQTPTPPQPNLPQLPDLPEQSEQSPLTPQKQIETLPAIGPGPSSVMEQASVTPKDFSNSFPPPPSTSAGVPTTTRFFDISTEGNKLVYVIDCSGSMNRNHAFRNAKAELIASLQRLNSTHNFHLIFYNENLFEFTNRAGKIEPQSATPANLERCNSFIVEMDNSGGTAHFPALEKALSYNPEVIFFLTDASEPAMSARELDQIKRLNRSRAAIHCIEFGIQPTELKLPNFLNQLSSENGGSYRYRDTNQFRALPN